MPRVQRELEGVQTSEARQLTIQGAVVNAGKSTAKQFGIPNSTLHVHGSELAQLQQGST